MVVYKWAIGILCAFWLNSLQAGLLLSPYVQFSQYSFRPVDGEKVPNYWGTGLGSYLGFSFRQTYDMVLFGEAITGSNKGPMNTFNNYLLNYGGGVFLRIADSILIGAKGGGSRYIMQNTSKHEAEVPGTWSGPTAGLVVGVIYKLDKRNYWQLTFEIMQSFKMEQISGIPASYKTKQHRLDLVALTFSYAFNGFVNRFIRNSVFSSIF